MKKEFYSKLAKRNKYLFALPLLLLFFIISGCKSSKIDDKTAVKIYVENLIVEEKYSSNTDSLRLQKQMVFKKYNLSRNDFDDFMKSMKDDPEKWKIFFEQADSYLNELKEKGVVN